MKRRHRAEQAYVDESGRNGYLLCAALVAPADEQPVRRALRGLLLPGESRLHTKDERDTRRRLILSTVCQQPVAAVIYVSQYVRHQDGRDAILRRIVESLDVDLLVLESRGWDGDRRDDSALQEARHKAGDELAWQHERPTSEPLLWAADAVAWAWGKGGDWRAQGHAGGERRRAGWAVGVRNP